MNVLIYGPRSSGKTLLAKSLVDYYKSEGHDVVVVDSDEVSPKRPSGETWRQFMDVMYERKSCDKFHLIMTVQHPSFLDVKPYEPSAFFDFYVNTLTVEMESDG